MPSQYGIEFLSLDTWLLVAHYWINHEMSIATFLFLTSFTFMLIWRLTLACPSLNLCDPRPWCDPCLTPLILFRVFDPAWLVSVPVRVPGQIRTCLRMIRLWRCVPPFDLSLTIIVWSLYEFVYLIPNMSESMGGAFPAKLVGHVTKSRWLSLYDVKL